MGEARKEVVRERADRYLGYDYLPLFQWQLPWAHLLREWQRFVDCGGPDASVGDGMQDVTKRIFRVWNQFRLDARSPSSFTQRVKGYRASTYRTMTWGSHSASEKTAATCRPLLYHSEALWTHPRLFRTLDDDSVTVRHTLTFLGHRRLRAQGRDWWRFSETGDQRTIADHRGLHGHGRCEERSDQLDGDREHDGGVLVGAHVEKGLHVA